MKNKKMIRNTLADGGRRKGRGYNASKRAVGAVPPAHSDIQADPVCFETGCCGKKEIVI